MTAEFRLDIQPQPDETTCGPTCLHAVYRYFGDEISLRRVIRETQKVEGGGTLAVLLGLHALGRNYDATIYTYNLQVFDPTWFHADAQVDLEKKLELREKARGTGKLKVAARAYRSFLSAGGYVRFEELTGRLIRRYLNRNLPILTGLSATYLYRSARVGPDGQYDDVGGSPEGHFVVLCGYDQEERVVQVADPWSENPARRPHRYWVSMDRLVNAILLGILTYDANLLVVVPRSSAHASPDRRQ